MDVHVVWDLLYPPRCPVCDRLMPMAFGRTGKLISVCPVCRDYGRPERVREPLCLKCGKPLEAVTKEYCTDCSRQKHLFSQGRAVFAYRGMEGSMHRFKNGNRRCYAGFFGQELDCLLQTVRKQWDPQVLVPVPIHWDRRRQRGYNQTELLTRELSRRSGIMEDRKLLVRGKKTRVQAGLNDRERIENTAGAFTVRGQCCPYRRILLIDDIYTTGSTADAAAQALLKAGAEEIFCASVCIGKGL